jgi:hypothetical protein
MSEALFGFAGVIVGALLTGAVEWWRETRRERRGARAAMRVLKNDLEVGAAMLGGTESSGLWWSRPSFSLPTKAWSDYRELLATGIQNEDDWDVIRVSFQEFSDVNSYRAARDDAAGGPGQASYSPTTDSAVVAPARERATNAVATVDRLLSPKTARPTPWEWLMSRLTPGSPPSH